MTISSPNFNDNGIIPVEFTCDGHETSPELRFQNIPNEAKSLVLVVEDPDAPSGTFVHWVLFNIDPKTEGFGEGEAPKEVKQGRNSVGDLGYVGPCPPSGTHRYIFTLFALKENVDLPEGVNLTELKEKMRDFIINEATLTGLYKR